MRFLLPLVVLTAVVVGLVLLSRGTRRALPPAAPPTSLAADLAAQEHSLGIRPCSIPGCAECQVWAARQRPDRRWWQPGDDSPATVHGRIAAVDTTARAGRAVPMLYLDPVEDGAAAWQLEATDPALAAELARFRVGDVVTLTRRGDGGTEVHAG